jgi:hypothetical protein
MLREGKSGQEVNVAEPHLEIAPAGWQITATTIDCDMVGDYVTIMVNKDWSCKCTWWNRYKRVADEDPGHRFPREIKRVINNCQGPYCKYVVGYRDRLVREETAVKE